MNFFSDLGDRIQQEWESHDCSVESFSGIASEHLHARPPHAHLDIDSLLNWAFTTNSLPEQRDLASRFGQPPLTVHCTPKFRIDTYFWVNENPGIHDHGFAGAFTLLNGSSLNTEYNFDIEHEVSPSLKYGQLSFKCTGLPAPGDVKPLPPGIKLIHSLLHLDQSTVSIVVRTHKVDVGPQLNYLWPGLAYNNQVIDAARIPTLHRRLELIEWMGHMRHPALHDTIQALLVNDRINEVWYLLDHVRHHYRARPDLLRRLIDRLRDQHGELIDSMTQVFIEGTRANRIQAIRDKVEDPDARFFLAALLVLRNRVQLADGLAQRYPAQSTSQTTFEILEKLERLLPSHIGENASLSKVLHMCDRTALTALLEGEKPPGIIADSPQPQLAATSISTVRESWLLRNVFF